MTMQPFWSFRCCWLSRFLITNTHTHCTQGYGNATPTTSGGRILVYTMGFLSILLFTAIIGKAGYVALVVADDALHRCRWSRLTRGWTAVAVWAAVFILWIGVIAGVAVAWSHQRMPRLNLPGQEKGSGTERGTLLFRDAIWFSYISVATVGFGDIYIPPDTMQGTDMLYLPLIFLTGFVLVRCCCV